MIVTEQQAKTKWCPMVRFSTGTDAAANRWAQGTPGNVIFNPDPCRCLASDCMAWRWVQDDVRPEQRGKPRTGFCGLAS